jgi:hypothetical protein
MSVGVFRDGGGFYTDVRATSGCGRPSCATIRVCPLKSVRGCRFVESEVIV